MFFESAHYGKNDAWRYVLGILLVFFSYAVGQTPLMVFLYGKGLDQDEISVFFKDMDFVSLGSSQTTGFVLILSMFIAAFIGLYLVVRFIHGKVFRRLITPSDTLNYSKIWFAFIVWLAIGLFYEAVGYLLEPETYTFRYDPSVFFPLLIVAILLIPLQSSFEELFFRGYLMQGIGIAVKNKWMPLLVSTLMFAGVHGTNPEIDKYGFWPMMSYYVSAGLFIGIITILDDSLELALGLHAATNIMGAVFVSYEGGAMQTDSLFKASEINPFQVTLFLWVGAALFIYICARKYKWGSWRVLFEKIGVPENADSK